MHTLGFSDAQMHTLPHAHPLRASDHPSHTDFLDRAVADILADSTALLSAVCRPDEPEGTHVVDLAAKGFHGLCLGSGHTLATAHGLLGAAVLVTVRRRLSETLAALGDWLRFAATWRIVPEVARPHIELIALHEAAHALATPIDGPPCAAALKTARQLSTAGIRMPTAAAMADTHGAAWAAALVVLCRRAAALRRHGTTLSGLFAAEAADFGIDFEDVARLVRTIPDHEPLRPLLADPIFLARIEHAIAPPDERARIIAANRTTARLDVPGERPTDPTKGNVPC